MKIWKLTEPFDHQFARAGRTGGTWQEGEYRERRRPLAIEWEPGSELVGDFSWPGLDTDIFVADRVAKALVEARVEGFELRSVQMRENSEPKKRRSKHLRSLQPTPPPGFPDAAVCSLRTSELIDADEVLAELER